MYNWIFLLISMGTSGGALKGLSRGTRIIIFVSSLFRRNAVAEEVASLSALGF